MKIAHITADEYRQLSVLYRKTRQIINK